MAGTTVTTYGSIFSAIVQRAGKMRRIVSAKDVPCPFCGVGIGAGCVIYRRRKPPRPHHGYHSSRVRDAQQVQHTLETLVS